MINTCGFIIYHPQSDTILLGRSTGSKEWSIPKGRQEAEESVLQTALRETTEEVNIPKGFFKSLPLYKLRGHVYPNKSKRLVPYLAVCEKKPTNLKCNATFIDKNGNKQPEFDVIKWVCVKNLPNYNIHITQELALKQALETLQEYGHI